MQCRNCGEQNPAGAGFCGSCGRQLSDAGLDGGLGPTRWNGVPRNGATGRDRASSDTTRYLCAAMQLNSKLATFAVHEIIDEEFKPPPTSPDVDLDPVLRHALAARARQVARDLVLTAILLWALWEFLTLQVQIVLLSLVVAWAVLFGEQLIATYGIVARQLRPGAFNPEMAPAPGSPRLRRRLAELDVAARGNVCVYGGYVPFVGSGVPISAWSFVLDVQRAAEGRECRRFTTTDIHDAVEARLRSVDAAGLRIDDRLFVDGDDLRRGDTRFLPVAVGPPRTEVPPVLLRALIEQPEDTVRPYMCVHVEGWGGQLVLSTFVRFVATRAHLFVEVSHSLLAPVKEEYQEVDRLLPQPTARQMLRIAGRSALRTPPRVVLAPGTVVRALSAPLARSLRRARQRREITQALRFNYGSSVSPRERAADTNFQRYFQQLDRDMHLKVVENALLEAIVSFLDDHGVDTSDLRQRQTTILNNGVFVAGGATVSAGSMAAGTGAQATTGASRFAEAARAAMPGQKAG